MTILNSIHLTTASEVNPPLLLQAPGLCKTHTPISARGNFPEWQSTQAMPCSDGFQCLLRKIQILLLIGQGPPQPGYLSPLSPLLIYPLPQPINSPTTCSSSPLPGQPLLPKKLACSTQWRQVRPYLGLAHSISLSLAQTTFPWARPQLFLPRRAKCTCFLRPQPTVGGGAAQALTVQVFPSQAVWLDPKLLKDFSVAPAPFSYPTQGLPPSPHHNEFPLQACEPTEGGSN